MFARTELTLGRVATLSLILLLLYAMLVPILAAPKAGQGIVNTKVLVLAVLAYSNAWDDHTIQERTRALAEQMVRIWPRGFPVSD